MRIHIFEASRLPRQLETPLITRPQAIPYRILSLSRSLAGQTELFPLRRKRKNDLASTKAPIKKSILKQPQDFLRQTFLIAPSLTELARLALVHREPLVIRSMLASAVGTR